MNNIPTSTITLMTVAGFLLFGVFCYYFFGNVEKNRHRGSLQNFVCRLYQINRWFLSLIAGIDAGVGGYYTSMQTTKIVPINEKKHAPIDIPAPPPPVKTEKSTLLQSIFGHFPRPS